MFKVLNSLIFISFSTSLGLNMTQFVFIIFCVLIVTNCSAELQCGLGEVEDSCPTDCEFDSCPINEDYSRSCKKPNKCPAPACKCIFNYSRANNGTCISTWECPAFPCSRPNEEYVSCPPYCPTEDCLEATPDGRCPFIGRIMIVVQCRPACRCKKGYWRNNGTCVPYAECPNRDNDTKDELSPLWQIFG